jgi:hypothetical protein
MVNPSSEHGLARVVHHKDFYLRGGDMTVMVSVEWKFVMHGPF